MTICDWFEPREPNGTATDKELYFYFKPRGLERVQHAGTFAKVSCVGADHGKVLRAVQKIPFNLRQNAVQIDTVKRSQMPFDGICCFDQRKWRSRFEDPFQLLCKGQMLRSVESLKTESRDCKIGSRTRQVSGQHICAVVRNSVFLTFVKAVYRLFVHTRAYIYGGDFADFGKFAEQVRPDLTSSGHKIDTRCIGLRRQFKSFYTGFAPSPYHPKRRNCAPVSVGTGTTIKDAGYEVGIVNVFAHKLKFEAVGFELQGFADVQ